jgi:vanillate O-demethylase monooxygenase subunit
LTNTADVWRHGWHAVATAEEVAEAQPLQVWVAGHDGAVHRARSVIVRTTASAGQLVDNFLDAAHFPYVHAGTFGVDDGAPLGTDAVRTDGWTVTSSFVAPYLDTVAEGGAGPAEHTVTKTAGPASSVHLRLELPGATVGILLACLPETATSTRVFKLLTRDDLHGDAGRIEQFVKEEDLILYEDLTILERYGDAGLPLDTRAELHTRSDRLSLAWRRVMAAAAAQVGEQAVTPW